MTAKTEEDLLPREGLSRTFMHMIVGLIFMALYNRPLLAELGKKARTAEPQNVFGAADTGHGAWHYDEKKGGLVDQHGQLVKADDPHEECKEFYDACISSSTIDSCIQCGAENKDKFAKSCKIDSMCKQLIIENTVLGKLASKKNRQARGGS